MAIQFNHSGHDYTELTRRWLQLADSAGIPLETISDENGLAVFCLESTPRDPKHLPIYVSAGVHGDECAPVWALLNWAESQGPKLRDIPLLLFPCLNPHGLIENTRLDAEKRDLNRLFHDPTVPLIRAWQAKVDGKRFLKCLNLHEDYDAVGIYLYELSEQLDSGRNILNQCKTITPIDSRETIDGQPFEEGIRHHRRDGLKEIVDDELDGYPEAIYLYLHHESPCLTFETPSEGDLTQRVTTHSRAIEAFDPALEIK